MFLIVTFEVKDYYNRELLTITAYSDQLDAIKNMKQLAMSAAWLVYSIGIMTWGILRRKKIVRYVSIIVISMSILKIFLMYLAFLDQPYRIISFIGLGLILLLASYLYHRFASFIHDKNDYAATEISG
jgi:uncharacterized membrane protein